MNCIYRIESHPTIKRERVLLCPLYLISLIDYRVYVAMNKHSPLYLVIGDPEAEAGCSVRTQLTKDTLLETDSRIPSSVIPLALGDIEERRACSNNCASYEAC